MKISEKIRSSESSLFHFQGCKNDGCEVIYAGKVSNDIKAFKRFTCTLFQNVFQISDWSSTFTEFSKRILVPTAEIRISAMNNESRTANYSTSAF